MTPRPGNGQGEEDDAYPSGMETRATPFLMFQNADAEEAMRLYTSIFDDGRVLEVSRYDASGPGPEGTVQVARFTLAGQEFRCSDSFIKHGFSFTPSFSIWVDVDSEAQLQRALSALGEGGNELMPLGDYGFSRRFCWLNDRYGVSWQLSLA